MSAAAVICNAICGFLASEKRAANRRNKIETLSQNQEQQPKEQNMNSDPLDRRPPYNISPPRYSVSHQMVTGAFELPNFRIAQNLGIVRGIVVRSRNIFATIGAGFQMVEKIFRDLTTMPRTMPRFCAMRKFG